MMFSDIQTFVARQIAADPTIGPLNAVFGYDQTRNQESQRQLINSTIKACGFCVEIGLPSVPPDDSQTNNGGSTFARAHIPVYVAEDRNLAHTPSGALLTDYVEAAVNARNDQRHVTATHSRLSVETDDGLIIWELVFLVRIQNAAKLATIVDAGLNPIIDAAGNTITSTLP